VTAKLIAFVILQDDFMKFAQQQSWSKTDYKWLTTE